MSELADAFQKQPDLEPLLAPWRKAEGNAALQYALALKALAANRTVEAPRLLDSVLPHLERGSRMRRSAFTDSVYPIAPDLLSTELADLSALSRLIEALRERARVLLAKGNLDDAEQHLMIGLSISDHLQQEPIGAYLLGGLSAEPELLAELAALEALRGNQKKVQLCVRRAAWAADALVRARSAIHAFGSWAVAPRGLERLRRLASTGDTPAGLRGEIAFALSYAHYFHLRGLLWGASSGQEDLLRELQHDPDPILARLASAGKELQGRGLISRLRSVTKAYNLH